MEDTTAIRAVRIVLIACVVFSLPPFVVFPMTGTPRPAYVVVLTFLCLNLFGLFLLRRSRPRLGLICLVVGLGYQSILFVAFYFGWLEAHAFPFILAGIAPVLTAMVVEDRRIVFTLWLSFTVGAWLIYRRPLDPNAVEVVVRDFQGLASHYSQVFGLLAFTASALLRKANGYQRALTESGQDLEARVAERTASLEKTNQDLELALNERAEAMDALEASQNQLVNAQKSESIGRLAGGVAHDFNNLLTVILSVAQLSQDRLNDDDPMQSEFEMITAAAEKGAELTGQLLAYSRQEVMSPEVVSLNAACEESADLLQRVIGEHVTLCKELNANPDTVFVDRSRLDQVLLNLTVNGRDAMANGGSLTIRTETDGDTVALEIIDDGHGIPNDLKPRIFDPFVSTKPADVGTGLGLSTVKGIVEQSGGTIEVSSEVGSGSTFRVDLPLVKADMWLQQRQTRQGLKQIDSQTVLIVEDNVHVLGAVERTLKSVGFNVLTADRPSHGLQYTTYEGRIDCILADLVMPEEDGLSFVRKFLADRPIPVVMMTGHVPDASIRGSLVEENVNVLRKPFGPDELVERVLQAMAEASAEI